MTQKLINLIYREIAEERGATGSELAELPSLGEAVMPVPDLRERDIVAYLKGAPNYSAIGKIVRDALDPNSNVILYPGANTDGVYLWPLELAHYVEKYHVRLPEHFLKRMESLNWVPPLRASLNLENLKKGLAT